MDFPGTQTAPSFGGLTHKNNRNDRVLMTKLDKLCAPPPPDQFTRGKYAGKSFLEVAQVDPAYIRYLILDCTFDIMEQDIANLKKWIELQ